MTRAFQGLIRGDAARAWQMHPLIFIFIPLAIASVIWAVFLFLKRRRDPEHFVWPTKHLRLAGLAVVSLVFAVYIVRMIWLFPTKEPLDVYKRQEFTHLTCDTAIACIEMTMAEHLRQADHDDADQG